MVERFVSIVGGSWLVASAFLWPHTALQRANAIAAGILAVLLSVLSLYLPRVRYAGALLALWIFLVAVLTSSVREATAWSNGVCAILILIGVHAGGGRRQATV